MESINLDTSILIEHYRAKDKSKSLFYKLSQDYNFVISSIVKYEILCGDKKKINIGTPDLHQTIVS
jgi:predicted nucleic acid-binding protein